MSGLGSFSYINRDYNEILAEVVARIAKITPEWTDWNQSDIGITILQLFSGIAEMLGYTQDVYANQLTLPTSTQRAAMINLTKSLGYTMANSTASSVDFLFSRTPYATTTNPTSLTSNIIAQYSRTFHLADTSQYNTDDVILLNNGTNSEYVIVESKIGSTITIQGITRYSYSIGDAVSKITKDRNVVIPDQLKCSTSGAITFETSVSSEYIIYGGSSYPNQTTILSFSSIAKTITLTNAFDFSPGDSLYLKSNIFSNNTLVLTITDVSDRTITVSLLPVWIQAGDTIARLVPGSQGTTRTENLASSTGLASQTKELTYFPIVTTSVSISVNEGTGAVNWTKVDSFFNSDSNDKHYTLEVQATDKGLITFGDGINGKIPDIGSTIVATYVQGGGVSGNVGRNTITKLTDTIKDVGGSSVAISVANPSSATGGANKEDLDVARVRAPALYASVYRAVSPSDYKALALGFNDATYGTISNAEVVESTIDNSVSLYVWAADDNGFASTASSGLKTALLNYLNERSGVGYLVSIVDGYLTSVNITATIYVLSGYTQSVVRSSVLAAIDGLFQTQNLTVGDDFYLGNLYETLEAIEGVSHADITFPLRPGVFISPLHLSVRGLINLTMSGGN
jgi:hypothetical protein